MRPIELIALAAVVVGWFATHLFSEARERRKEVRSQLDKLLDKLFSLEKDAVEFHSCATFDSSKTGGLLGQVDRIERILGRLPIVRLDDVVGPIIHHRRAITLRNFEASTFKPQSAGSDLLNEIASATRDLEDILEERYASEYPGSFPYFARPSTHTLTLIAVAALLALCTVIGLHELGVV